MTVYVDPAIHGYGRMIMCHMASPLKDELFAMATAIGVAHRHYQDPLTTPGVSRPHFDVCKAMRAKAVSLGAQEVDRYQMYVVSNVAMNTIRAQRGLPLIDPIRLLRSSAHYHRICDWLSEPAQACLVPLPSLEPKT